MRKRKNKDSIDQTSEGYLLEKKTKNIVVKKIVNFSSRDRTKRNYQK